MHPQPQQQQQPQPAQEGATGLGRSRNQPTLERRLAELAQQVSDLARLVQTSVNLQWDIQRAIKQEVAAACARAGGSEAASVPLPRSAPLARSQCLVCLDQPADCAFFRCGHLCACYSCACQLREADSRCPMCRAPITEVMRVYVPS
eukprot:m.224763 g.224763  ORF g.224763 m.224763 type:complete len:147 (-) comp85670_c0_seq1:247-687(-)